jgi:hypothetical protein
MVIMIHDINTILKFENRVESVLFLQSIHFIFVTCVDGFQQIQCTSDAEHPCNAAIVNNPATSNAAASSVGEFGAAAASITPSPELQTIKEEEEGEEIEMPPNAAPTSVPAMSPDRVIGKVFKFMSLIISFHTNIFI